MQTDNLLKIIILRAVANEANLRWHFLFGCLKGSLYERPVDMHIAPTWLNSDLHLIVLKKVSDYTYVTILI